ncbi:MAG: PepSY domain-containing protein, partial [Candidatus Eisenbacteria bacterium]|nr:PepSY domain-containing protein [Candidatus Eisenbacteria bacterium]
MRKARHISLMLLPLALLLAGGTASYAFVEVDEAPLQISRLGWVEEGGLLIQPTEKSSLEKSSALSALTERYGGNWRFNRNAITGGFHTIYGSGFQFAGSISTSMDAEQAAQTFVAANPDIFGAGLDALKTAEIRNGVGKWVVHFDQVVNGVRVVGGRAHVVFTESGRIFAMGSDVYPNVLDRMGGATPILSEAEAISIASRDIGFLDGTDIVTHHELVILPVREDAGELLELNYRLAYRLDLFVIDPRSHWSTYVDAQSGEILWRESLIRTLDYTGHIQGDVEWDGYCDGYTNNYPVEEMIVNISGVGSTISDTNGDFTLSYGGTDTRTATARFLSQWLNVDRYTGTNAQFSGSITPGNSLTIDWSNSNSLPSERDCFAYLNHEHSWLNEVDPSFTGMDYEVPCSVERTDGYCPGNAWYDYYGVNFCSESSSYGNTGRLGDVAYHEYGHGITHEIYNPNDPPSDLHEGNSDVAALLLTREPRLGLGFYLNNCTSGIRNAENSLIYPDDLTGAGHTDGQIISGFIWDSWQALMDAFPWEYADDVIAHDWHFARMLGLPHNMPDQIYWTFVADDDDGNLDNGTPHHAYLCVGATNHGFDCPEIISPISIVHTPVTEQTSTTDPTLITANISSSSPINESACRVTYRVDGGSFSNVGMTNVGGDDFAGYIPAQAACTFVEYYIYGEDDNAFSATHPSNAPVSLHGFYVGEITTVFEDDFETNLGWSVGDTGDDATTGVWERCDPQGTTAQPENDHTPAPGVSAYITQCAAGSGQGSYDIDGGKTTLMSPVFDLSSYSSATASYYRWYSNDTGSGAGEDYWVVQVTDDGWSTWATLENTNVTNRSWLQMQFDLGSLVNLNHQVQFRFIASDEGTGSIVEAGVDDFMISSCGGAVSDTEPPEVTVVAPNGGEEINALSAYTITWTSSDNIAVTGTIVLLSTDGGSTYPDTLATLAGETSFEWAVPDVDEPDCRIRVVCVDAESNEGSDISDADFRIIPHDGTAPEV